VFFQINYQYNSLLYLSVGYSCRTVTTMLFVGNFTRHNNTGYTFDSQLYQLSVAAIAFGATQVNLGQSCGEWDNNLVCHCLSTQLNSTLTRGARYKCHYYYYYYYYTSV